MFNNDLLSVVFVIYMTI